LEQDDLIEVVGEAGSGEDAVLLAGLLEPDVVLLDLALPDTSGVEAARRIRETSPETKIVILSAYDDQDYVVAAMEVGAAAYLLKTARGKDVIDAIHGVQQGQVILHPSVAAKLRRSIRRADTDEPVLSPREMQILRLAAKGLHNKDIADTLSISIRTVEGHLSHILVKLDVSSRTEAVVYGAAHHWFSLT
jgi:DNA-binding NarL/FixJ family response regulator